MRIALTTIALAGAWCAWLWRPAPHVARPAAIPHVAAAPAARVLPAEAHPAAPTESHVDDSRELALAMERAMLAVDDAQRGTAFAHLLPPLLERAPAKAVDLWTRQPPGAARDALRDEIARQWIVLDRAAASAWLESIEDPPARELAIHQALHRLAARSRPEAIAFADRFGLRGDGSLDHALKKGDL